MEVSIDFGISFCAEFLVLGFCPMSFSCLAFPSVPVLVFVVVIGLLFVCLFSKSGNALDFASIFLPELTSGISPQALNWVVLGLALFVFSLRDCWLVLTDI